MKFHRFVKTCLSYLCPAGCMHTRIGMTTDRDNCKRQHHADLSKGWPPLVDGNAVYLHRTMSIIDVLKLSTIRVTHMSEGRGLQTYIEMTEITQQC